MYFLKSRVSQFMFLSLLIYSIVSGYLSKLLMIFDSQKPEE